jgi:hypothetical protein
MTESVLGLSTSTSVVLMRHLERRAGSTTMSVIIPSSISSREELRQLQGREAEPTANARANLFRALYSKPTTCGHASHQHFRTRQSTPIEVTISSASSISAITRSSGKDSRLVSSPSLSQLTPSTLPTIITSLCAVNYHSSPPARLFHKARTKPTRRLLPACNLQTWKREAWRQFLGQASRPHDTYGPSSALLGRQDQGRKMKEGELEVRESLIPRTSKIARAKYTGRRARRFEMTAVWCERHCSEDSIPRSTAHDISCYNQATHWTGSGRRQGFTSHKGISSKT